MAMMPCPCENDWTGIDLLREEEMEWGVAESHSLPPSHDELLLVAGSDGGGGGAAAAGGRNAGCAVCSGVPGRPLPAARCPLPLPTTAPTEGPIINAGTSREILSFTCGPDLHYYLPR
jgi:hypothetical protein